MSPVTLDAAYVLQYVAGLRSLSAQQRLACDVSGNGSLSAFDATLLLQRTIGLISTFPVNGACDGHWAFMPIPAPAPGQTLIQPQLSTDQCVAGGIAYATVAASLDDQDFAAMVFGDCTGNWRPSQAASAILVTPGQRRNAAAVRMRWLPAGRLALAIGVDAAAPIHAWAMRISYDPATLRFVETRTVGGARTAMLATNDREVGIIRLAAASGEAIAADGRPLVVVQFEAMSRRRAVEPVVSVRINDE